MLRAEMLMHEKGWSQAELARKTGLSPTAVSLILRRGMLPYDHQAQALKVALGFSGDALALIDEMGDCRAED